MAEDEKMNDVSNSRDNRLLLVENFPHIILDPKSPTTLTPLPSGKQTFIDH